MITKKIILGGVFSVVIVVTSLWLSEYSTKTTQQQNTITQEAQKLNKDTDGDGLKDWEEILLGTDPLDPTSTQEEGVQEELEELRARYKEYNETKNFAPDTSSNSGNLTEVVAKELFVRYIQSKQSGSFETQKDNIINDLISDNAINQSDFYIIDNLTLSLDNTTTSLHTYGNEVMKRIARYPDINAAQVMIVLYVVIEEKNSSALTEILNQARLYKALSSDLSTLTTPSQVSSLHLTLINLIHNAGEVLLNISNTSNDSIKTLLNADLYQKNLVMAEEILGNIAKIFKTKSITFEIEEEGYLWQTL